MIARALAAFLAMVAVVAVFWLIRTQDELHKAEIEAAQLRGALADCRAATNIRNEDAERDAKFDPNNLPSFDDLDPADRLREAED